MIDRVGECAVHHAQFSCNRGRVRQQLTDPHSPVVVGVPGELVLARTNGKRLLPGRHPGDPLPVANVFGQWPAIHLAHLGLVVPKVMVTGAAAHKQVNRPLGLCRVMQSGFCIGTGGLEVRSQQLCHRRSAQAQGATTEQLAAGQIQLEVTRCVHGDCTGSCRKQY